MQVIVFMVGCTVPLLVIGCVILWREKQWEKQNEQKNA
jgi:hypothetical protein